MMHRFEKMHGLGNDFVVFDLRETLTDFDPALVAALADRHTGIGFDQMVLIGPSDVASIRVEIRNADGSSAEICGNALRCVGLLIGGELSVDTGGGIARVVTTDDGVEVTLPEPSIAPVDAHSLTPENCRMLSALLRAERVEPLWHVDVGNPHLIVLVDDIGAVDVANAGPFLEHDPLFPDRINVAFARIASADRIDLRMWERGAGATRACGSGACAAAAAAIKAGLTGDHVIVDQPGGGLSVRWVRGEELTMVGHAAHVYSGRIEVRT